MKLLISVLALIPVFAVADQRMETVGGFCHAITPEGFETANDDNEVFISNCINSIRQNADGTGSGSYLVTIKYPANAAPFTNNYKTSGDESGQVCVMVDSNGTTYTTQDWNSSYKVRNKYYWKTKTIRYTTIEYSLTCRNGDQQ